MAITYNIYWSLTSPVTFASNKIENVTSPYTHDNLLRNTIYYYAITAYDTIIELESGLSNEMNCRTSASNIPGGNVVVKNIREGLGLLSLYAILQLEKEKL